MRADNDKRQGASIDRSSRRRFMQQTAAVAAFTMVPRHVLGGAGHTPPSEKLNIAGIGIGGRGEGDLDEVGSENIVALCDVDEAYAGRVFAKYPKARKWHDFRKMLDEQKDIDAVVIATPDHTHAVISMAAIQRGKHVYCEKPLAHSIWECRQVAEAARKAGVATQLGNQGQATEENRLVSEFIWDGAIGPVREVHAWCNRYISPRGIGRPTDTPPVPKTVNWDLWLGPARYRPYHPSYLPFSWRGWWDFGNGALGDMGCHIMDPVFCALKLAEADHFTCEVVESYGMNEQTAPRGTVVRYSFPARAGMGPVELYWHDGRDEHGRWLQPPRPEGVPEEETLGDGKHGSYFVGTKGICTAGTYGGGVRLLPAARMAGFRPPEPTLDRGPGEDHTRDWLNAIREGRKASSDFSYAGPLTEFVQFGRVALFAGKKVEYDFKRGEITNDRALDALLTKQYREGWALPC